MTQAQSFKYFVYQIPLRLLAPVHYNIHISGVELNGIPTVGQCWRDPMNPTTFYFWNEDGRLAGKFNFMEVKNWAIEAVKTNPGLKVTYLYPQSRNNYYD